MDVSHFLRRPRRGSPDPGEKVNQRSVLYKAKGNRQVKKLRDAKKREAKEKRNSKLHLLRGIGGGGEMIESKDEMSCPSIRILSKGKGKGKCSSRGKCKEDEETEMLNRLAEYRLRKQEKKATDAKGKKPVFKVGAVHHKPYSFNQEIPKSFTFKSNIGSQSLKKSSQEDHLSISPSSKETADCLTNDISMETPPQKENIVNHVRIERPPINKTPFKPPLPTLAEEKEEGIDLFKAPYPSTPSSRRHRRSSISPLIDALRTDICFKRGTSSDIRRAKKGPTFKVDFSF
ncbi:uncharacterized protein [Lepeophtheirus salmonis]|uniref:uncharacterized protein n=1 Tax=Lepeophtheirus salmonis TaxID=72036 RepID=UPI001AEAA653|nr:uncharacterized protein LOC121125131 isoform X1 [Lepeophtheirus salmonis]